MLTDDPSTADRPTVVISANSGFNIVRFRGALLTGLQNAGYRVIALAPAGAHATELAERGVQYVPVRISRSGLNPLADLRLLAQYVRVLRRVRPAVYCSFTIKPNIYGCIAARICAVPAIANVTGLGTAFLAKGGLWRLTRSMYRAALKRARMVYFHNGEDLRTFVDAGIVKPPQARVIAGSGIDTQYYQASGSPSAEPLVFLFIGRLLRDKGIRELVDAARIVKQRLPAARFQLLGDIDPENRTSVSAQELRSWIEEGLVEHLGDQQDVRPFIEHATAVVLPSYREGLSRALLEAAAMARPLIGTNVPGVRELVEEAVTGALCEPCDAQSLAAAVERIASLPSDQLRQLGARGRSRAENEFDETIVVRTYLDAIEALL